jgi:aromatic ring-opening dioxygenase LigB subunit
MRVIAFAAIAPHGDVDAEPALRTAMEELGRRCAAAEPETVIVVTPHNVHVDGHFAVVTAARVGEWETDRELARQLLGIELPILGVSYGGNDPAQAEMPIDWGTEIPLQFVSAPRIVVVCPARERSLEEHVRLGEAIAARPGRHALIASADHAHAHHADGPYGFDPAAAVYDARLLDVLRSDRLDFRPLAEHVAQAKADSLWQLLILQGAVGEHARADLIAYAAPSYYGMAVAEVIAAS